MIRVGPQCSESISSLPSVTCSSRSVTKEAKRLRELEQENGKLKKLLAEKLLECEAMRDVLTKKW